MNVLQAACFWLVTIFLAIYFVLDGLNSGIGFWYGLAHKQDRRALLRAVTGLRDASELWLVGAVAVLFVAFPPVSYTHLDVYKRQFQVQSNYRFVIRYDHSYLTHL